MTRRGPLPPAKDHHDHRDDPCRAHVRRYLLAPFLADAARHLQGNQVAGWWTIEIVTLGVPPSLQRTLEQWTVDEATPDEEIAQFIGWSVDRVREHR